MVTTTVISTESIAILSAWSLALGLTATIGCVSAVYVRGWYGIRKRRPASFTGERLAYFLSGMAVLWLAIASPVDGFADVLLSAHMVRHFLPMSVVPPLVLLGAPIVPLLRGLPRWLVKTVVGPMITSRWVRTLGDFVTAPAVAWLSFNLVFLYWHLPTAYDFTLRHEEVHDFEHIRFLTTALVFWWVILHPWPSRFRSDNWLILLYLLLAYIVNTALSAFLVFCNRPIYQFYISGRNPFHISALADQVAGGVITWVLNSFVFLVPAMVITVHLMSPSSGTSYVNRSLTANRRRSTHSP